MKMPKIEYKNMSVPFITIYSNLGNLNVSCTILNVSKFQNVEKYGLSPAENAEMWKKYGGQAGGQGVSQHMEERYLKIFKPPIQEISYR